jgi:hypothetical protein
VHSELLKPGLSRAHGAPAVVISSASIHVVSSDCHMRWIRSLPSVSRPERKWFPDALFTKYLPFLIRPLTEVPRESGGYVKKGR